MSKTLQFQSIERIAILKMVLNRIETLLGTFMKWLLLSIDEFSDD